MTIAFPAPPSTTAPLSQEVRILTKRYGGVLGPVFTVAVGDKYFAVGELTLSQLKRGISPTELDLYEIDPDAPEEDY